MKKNDINENKLKLKELFDLMNSKNLIKSSSNELNKNKKSSIPQIQKKNREMINVKKNLIKEKKKLKI